MNILVCISSVPDTTSKIQFVINPYDEFGLTRAMMIKESLGAKITVITVGDPSVEPVIRKSLAIGADNAIRIDFDPKDSFSTATAISEYIKANSFDIIIAGRESIDYNGGAVPGMMSEILSMPFVNACIGLEIENDRVRCVREIDGGKEMLIATLPVIIAGQKGLVEESELRIPNMRGIMQSRTKPLEVVSHDNIENKTSTISFKHPEKKSSCKIVDAENVHELVNLLHNEAKVI